MALLFTDGFDTYGTASGSYVTPSGVMGRRGWIPYSSPKTRDGRIDGKSVSLGYNAYIKKVISGTEATKTVGVALKVIAANAYNNNFMQFYEGSNAQLALKFTTTGYISIYLGSTLLATSSARVPVGEWHYIEFKSTIDNTNGSYEVRLDGTNILSDSSIDTQYSSNAYWDVVYLRSGGGWDYIYFDDFYLTDSTGSTSTGFLGTIHIETLLPNADAGTNQWTTSSGTDHYAMVDDNPPDDDTSYLEDSTSGNRELFDLPAVSPSSLTIKGVSSVVDQRVTDATTVDMKFVNKSGTTTTTGSAQTVSSTSQARFDEIYDQDPDTSTAWTKTTFEAAQFGFEVA